MTDWSGLLTQGRYGDIAAALIEDYGFDTLAISEDPYGAVSDLVTVTVQDQLPDGCGGGGYYRAQPPEIYIHPSIARRNNFTLLHEFGHHLQQQHAELAFLILDLSAHARKLAEEAISDQLASKILIPWSDEPLDARFVHPAQVMAGLHAGTVASRSAVLERVNELLPPNAKWILAVADLGGRVQHARTTYSDAQPAKGSVQPGFAALAEEAAQGHKRRGFHEGIRYSTGSELHGMIAEANLDAEGGYVFVALTPESRFGTGDVVWPTFECSNPACGESFERKSVKRECGRCGDPACPVCNRCGCDPTVTDRFCSSCFTRWSPGEIALGQHDCY